MPISVLEAAAWLNEPPAWSLDDAALRVTTGEKTDFWQDTFYGFRRDDGHCLLAEQEGDLTATVSFEGEYEMLYDQAGLMLRVDAENWIKLGIEYTDGVTNFSLVCTQGGRSDWSVVPQPRLAGPQTVRITRIGPAAIAHYRTAGGHWQMMRLCPFSADSTVQVGPMACSPQRAGFQVRFTEFSVAPPIENPLHG